MPRPPEPTHREFLIIHAAHDAIRADSSGALGPAGAGNWGTPDMTMGEVWSHALEAGIISQEAYDLARRDSGGFWGLRCDGSPRGG